MRLLFLVFSIVLITTNLFAFYLVFDLCRYIRSIGKNQIGEEGVVLLVFPVLYLPLAWIFGLLKRILVGGNLIGKQRLIVNTFYFAIPFIECVPLFFPYLGTGWIYFYFSLIVLSVLGFIVDIFLIYSPGGSR